jgi:hypothetical protein
VLRVWFCFGRRSKPLTDFVRPAISGPSKPQWTMVSIKRESTASSDFTPSLYAQPRDLADLERGDRARAAATPPPGRADAASHYSWDPRWERASRWPANMPVPAPGADQPQAPPSSAYANELVPPVPAAPSFARGPFHSRADSEASISEFGSPSSRPLLMRDSYHARSASAASLGAVAGGRGRPTPPTTPRRHGNAF